MLHKCILTKDKTIWKYYIVDYICYIFGNKKLLNINNYTNSQQYYC